MILNGYSKSPVGASQKQSTPEEAEPWKEELLAKEFQKPQLIFPVEFVCVCLF